jgi:hypothetical protein
MARQDQEKQKKLEPKRLEYAVEQITKEGYKIHYQDKTKIIFEFNNHNVTLYPYSGWHTGKSIKDGRGIEKLLNQINNGKSNS